MRKRRKTESNINIEKDEDLKLVEVRLENGEKKLMTPEKYEEYKETQLRKNLNTLPFLTKPLYEKIRVEKDLEYDKNVMYLSYPNLHPLIYLGRGKFLTQFSDWIHNYTGKYVIIIHKQNITKEQWTKYINWRRNKKKKILG